MKSWKPILLIILLLVILFYTRYKLWQENFASQPTHILKFSLPSRNNNYDLDNEIILTQDSSTSDTGFIHLYNLFGKYYFPKGNYTNNIIPQLTIQTYDKCPILNYLYYSFPHVEPAAEEQPAAAGGQTAAEVAEQAGQTAPPINYDNQKKDAVRGSLFKHMIEKTFFNISQDTEMDYPILDIKIFNKRQTINYNMVPQLYLGIKPFTGDDDISGLLKYIDNQNDYSHKQASFGVKEDFTELDIMKFMDFCFTTLCWGALDIRLLKPLDNHYYGFPCQNSTCNGTEKTYFYLLPVRIRQLCYDENVDYTRAKCNRCSSNIIVYFHQPPKKFTGLKNNIQTTYLDSLQPPDLLQ